LNHIIYIHHYYSYETFWYFCHGIDINPKDVPTYISANRRNKNKIIEKNITLIGSYKEVQFEIRFVGDSNWNKKDGEHVFDYTISLLEKNLIGDKGYHKFLGKNLTDVVKFLNSKCGSFKDKLSFFYIDWEPTDDNDFPILKNELHSEINLFLDDSRFIKKNQYLSYTHIISSYIFPNTINLREYYFFADYLKYKNDYKYKINFPIRRITNHKKKIFHRLQALNNPHINCTISSFTEYGQHEDSTGISSHKLSLYDGIVKNLDSNNIIKKRGYNLDDWGGEWNSNNMNEYMYKLLTISDVVLVPEISQKNWINEKSLSHILAAKPFISIWKDNIDFYINMCKKYNMELVEYPIEYKYMIDIYDFLDNITRDEIEWKKLVNKLYEFSNNLRNNIIEIIHNNNDYFNFIIDKTSKQKTLL
jgi:hypothetical protein